MSALMEVELSLDEDRAEVRLADANPKSTISLTMWYALFYYVNKHVIWFLDVGNNGI